MQSTPFDSFMDYSPAPIAIFDEGLRFVKVNQAMAEVHEVTTEACFGKTIAEVLPLLSTLIQPLLAQVLDTGELATSTVTGGLPAYVGDAHDWVAVCFPCGQTHIACMAIGASQQRTEEAVRRINQKLESTRVDLERSVLINEMAHCFQTARVTGELHEIVGRFAPRLFPRHSGALCVIDPSGSLVEASATWGDTTACELVFAPTDCWALREGRAHLVNDAESGLVCPHAAIDKQYPQICVPMIAQAEMFGFVHLQNRAVRRPAEAFTEGERRLARVMAEEIALSLANVGSREVLRQHAFRDALTGVYNRRFLQEALDLELRRAKRKRHPVALIMLDVDGFKQFNDTYGHAAGDSFLQAVATSLQAGVRSNDVVCRYGGDEFCIVMPEASGQDALMWAHERISIAMPLSIEWQGKTLAGPMFSMGVAAYPACETLDALFREADSALYAAKACDRGQVKPGISISA